jgi:hypothetical protein
MERRETNYRGQLLGGSGGRIEQGGDQAMLLLVARPIRIAQRVAD